jgi:hypothetical protein
VNPEAAASRIVIEYGDGRSEILEASEPTTMMGYALAYAGDVDADGYGDLIAGVPRFGVGPASARSDFGRVMIFFGGKDGFDRARTIEKASPIDGLRFFGSSVGGGSDLDGDGRADLVASHPGDPVHVFLLRGGPLLGSFETVRSDVGQVLFSGDRASFALARGLWIGLPGRETGRVLFHREGRTDVLLDSQLPGFGSSLAIGDWDGDRELGFAGGAIGAVGLTDPIGFSDTRYPPDDEAVLGQFGRDVRALDANGDGRSDLLVSAPGSPSAPSARFFLYLGSADGLGTAPVLLIEPE